MCLRVSSYLHSAKWSNQLGTLDFWWSVYSSSTSFFFDWVVSKPHFLSSRSQHHCVPSRTCKNRLATIYLSLLFPVLLALPSDCSTRVSSRKFQRQIHKSELWNRTEVCLTFTFSRLSVVFSDWDEIIQSQHLKIELGTSFDLNDQVQVKISKKCHGRFSLSNTIGDRNSFDF